MVKKLRFLVATWLSTLVLMALQKPIFLAWYAEQAAEHSWAEYLQVIWHGLLLDSTMAGYITALPILFTLVTLWTGIPDRVGRLVMIKY